jgi:Tol biopolymer transport system component
MLTNTGKVRDAVISPDGKYLAYVVAESGLQSLWVRQVATSSAVQIVPPAETGYVGLTFSSDGNYLYYVRKDRKNPLYGTSYQVPVLGGAPRKLTYDVDSPVTLSPDGKQLAFVRGDMDTHETFLVVANSDGTAERKLATRKSPADFSQGGPAWSPDGKVIAVGATEPGQAFGVFIDVLTGKEQNVTLKHLDWVSRVAWLPEGNGLLASASGGERAQQIWHLAYPGGQTHRVTNDTNNYSGVSLTADGKVLVTASTRLPFSVWGVAEGGRSRPRDISPGTSEMDGFFGFSWTPEGRLLYISPASGKMGLWVMSRDGSNPQEFPVGVTVGLGVSACPDGRYILFGSEGIVRVDSEGRNLKRLTTGKYDYFPHCSADGQWVVYRSDRGDQRTLWKIPVDGGTPVQLRDKRTVYFALSRDGKWIACAGYVDSNPPMKLVVLPFQGGPSSKTFDAPPGSDLRALDWAPDGHSLTFAADQKGASNVWTQPLAGGPAKEMTDFDSGVIFSLAWSPDGKQLTLVRRTGSGDAVLISNFLGSEK